MRNDCCKKALVVGIIVLFIGVSGMSIAGSLSTEKPAIQESLPFGNSIRDNSGISLITIKVAGEMGLTDWYGSDVAFTITYESDDIAAVYYGVDGEWMLYTEPFVVSEDGEHVLEWYAVDFEGNQSEVDGPFIFNIDQTPPDIDLVYEYTGDPIQGWEFLFTATATDDISGMDRVEFYLNDELQDTVYGPGPIYQWSFWLRPPFPTITVKVVGYDKAENSAEAGIYPSLASMAEMAGVHTSLSSPIQSGLQSFLCVLGVDVHDSCQSSWSGISSVKIVGRENYESTEKLSPESSMVRNTEPSYIVIVVNRRMGNNGWCVGSVTLSLIPDPDGIVAAYYKLDDGEWTLYSEPVIISDDGAHSFSWYIVDSEGHTSTPDSISLKIDQTSPEINLKNERLAIDRVKVIADVYDETSNIDRVEFENRGVDFTDYDFPYEWVLTGIFNGWVYATVYDKAGNSNYTWIWTWRSHSHSQQSSSSLFIWFSEKFPLLERLLNLI